VRGREVGRQGRADGHGEPATVAARLTCGVDGDGQG
jgi:hypothetical protein